jgi:predicted O-methyltransferase YrrM
MPPAEAYEKSKDIVLGLYQGILGRDPDEEGMAMWTDALMNGLPVSEVARRFIASEEFERLGQPKSFVPRDHFYSPIVDPKAAERHLARLEAKPVPESVPGVALDRAAMVRTWHDLLPFFSRTAFPATPCPGFHYAFENPSYSWGDGSVLHAMICRHRPKRIIEVGSGWSSACMLDTVDKDLGGNCDLTFIDPFPELLRELAGDAISQARVMECNVQDVPLEIFDTLKPDDILFIDSTHVLKTGSDVCFELFEILPRLVPGVLVHLHDMFWPFEYPRFWVIDENRSWNEIYAIRAFLMHNSAWDIIMFNDYLAKLEKEMLEETWPSFLQNPGGALWLRRR